MSRGAAAGKEVVAARRGGMAAGREGVAASRGGGCVDASDGSGGTDVATGATATADW